MLFTKRLYVLLSYVWGFRIERRKSVVNGELEVWFQNGRYVLHSAQANYSFHTLHKVFQRVFKIAEIKNQKINTCLILGFGAGSVASILVDELKMTPVITGVEVDAEVISLAKKYFAIDRYKNLKLIQEDAKEFAKRCDASFDLVVSDVFVDKTVPDAFTSSAYVKNLIRITASGGIGFLNFIAENTAQQKQLADLQAVLQQQDIKASFYNVSPLNVVLKWKIQ